MKQELYWWSRISIHALREEGDRGTATAPPIQVYFYPRPPRGGRRDSTRFSILSKLISIHALREEGDHFAPLISKYLTRFLSTPSARRATNRVFTDSISALNFYPRPPRGGRLYCDSNDWQRIRISIHALREEGDPSAPAASPATAPFLSTPSARRATFAVPTSQAPQVYFYPRPPRGGRPRLTLPWFRGYNISIHALREEGDRSTTRTSARRGSFLSTPSARRATAKTERKHPAFVSLYTSLHKLQRDACKPNRKITPLLAQTAGIPVRSVPENYVCCRFALAGHQKISTLSWANSGCSPTCSTLVW